ncbi:MAG: globin [Dehalococcoidia bacterium]|nr:globin [Dehalococcoidia bacterium]
MTEPTVITVFERFGGRDAIHRVVERFYHHVEADTPLRAVYPDDLEPGKEKLELFLEQWLGGEGRYSALYGHPRLRARHLPFTITQYGAGRWLRHMRQAMSEEAIPGDLQRSIFESLAPLARHMVNSE